MDKAGDPGRIRTCNLPLRRAVSLRENIIKTIYYNDFI
jgi:hypothetical protein